jgi:hypothetical protein
LNLERNVCSAKARKRGQEWGNVGGFVERTAMDLSAVFSKGDTRLVEWCRQDVEDVIAEYEKVVQGFAGTRRSTLERQLAENRATLAALGSFAARSKTAFLNNYRLNRHPGSQGASANTVNCEKYSWRGFTKIQMRCFSSR